MSKYSDHTTVGGQVLAHRVRMMRQNWNVIWIVGRVSFLLSFVFYHMFKWKINDIWGAFKDEVRQGILFRNIFWSTRWEKVTNI